MELTTVADDLAVIHQPGPHPAAHRYDGLTPDTDYTFDGVALRTLPRPGGELLSRLATVNDVHFGETECGRIDDHPQGPIQRAAPGAPAYPETMNRAAVDEMMEIAPDPVPMIVVVKGDLTQDGRPEEFAAFEACYRTAFGSRLHVVRGNHDAYRGQHDYSGDQWIELPGVAIALVDTVIPGVTTGTIRHEQLEWLDDMTATADRPVIVMGHHQQWIDLSARTGSNDHRSDGYFGLHPDASEAFSALVARRTRIIAYTAGHTHRHRVRPMACGVPSIEIGCVKDFPGTWAEYRVYEGGVTQVVHRISHPDALAWSEQCRHLYRDFGVDYQSYALGSLEDRCCNIPLR